MPKNLLKETETYYTIVKGTLNTWMGTFLSFGILRVNQLCRHEKFSAWLTSALETRTTVRRAKRKPERTWFVNNANGR